MAVAARDRLIERTDGTGVIEVLERESSGERVLLVPSALRGAHDFDNLSAALSDAGYATVAIYPRGAGRSTPPTGAETLHDMAGDIAVAIRACSPGPVHLVGHGLGNTFARAAAADYPGMVRSLTLLACGPVRRFAPKERPALADHFAPMYEPGPEEQRMAAVGELFSPGGDSRTWLEGWFPPSAPLVAALFRTSTGDWWTASPATPILLVQGRDDRFAPPASGEALLRELGPERADLVTLANCGHAILPEQPTLVAELLLQFLTRNGERADNPRPHTTGGTGR